MRARARTSLRAIALGLALLGLGQLGAAGWIHAKSALAQVLVAGAWQRTLAGGERVRPWPWADTWPVGVLEIPRLDTSLVVLAGSTGSSLAFGPGHTEGSALPGERGTSIVSGHRDTHFAVLRDLDEGDAIQIERRDGIRVRYAIESLEIIDVRHAGLRADPDGQTMLLVTCWPFDTLQSGGPLRYVATARALSF